MEVKLLLSISLFFLLFGSVFAQKKSKNPKEEKNPSYIHSFPPPDYLLKDKTYYFRGEKNGLKMDLQLKRKTVQKIRYELSIIFPNHQKFSEKGMVYMTFAYDMGTEEKLQESTGEMESCTNFFPLVENGLIICIGEDYDNDRPPTTDKLFVDVSFNRENYPPMNIDATPELFQLNSNPLKK